MGTGEGGVRGLRSSLHPPVLPTARPHVFGEGREGPGKDDDRVLLDQGLQLGGDGVLVVGAWGRVERGKTERERRGVGRGGEGERGGGAGGRGVRG